MDDLVQVKERHKSLYCLPFSKKMVATGIFFLLIFFVPACVQEAPKKGGLPPTLPRTSTAPPEKITPPPAAPKAPAVPSEKVVPSAAPLKTPSVSPEAVRPAPAPIKTPPAGSLQKAESVPPQTMRSSVRPAETTPVTTSSSVFVQPPGVPQRFHLMHPIGNKESCVTGNCHRLKQTINYTHAPVAAGACVLCHTDVISNPPLGLRTTRPDLCFFCHKEQKSFYNEARFVHGPVKDKCMNCHNPHGSWTSKFFLIESRFTLCLSCHRNGKKNPNEVPQIAMARVPHKPVAEGNCVGCHSPHASNFKKLLKEGPKETQLCFSCHKEKAAEIKNASFVHGPIREGLCTACHAPHGSDSPKLLKYYFVKKFYNPFDPKLYALCFHCHKETLVLDERTTTLTNFRNGDRNLHYLHVHREKGRTCLACHEVHAGSQERQIRTSTPFGDWSIPIKFFKTQTGGKCLLSCHAPKEYDRVNPVKLEVDTAPASRG